MSKCLVCKTSDMWLVSLIKQEGVPHENKKHKHQYSYKKLFACSRCDHGKVIIFDHDCSSHHNNDPWDMTWYAILSPESSKVIQKYVEYCWNFRSWVCHCNLHKNLRRQIDNLSWKRSETEPDAEKAAWLKAEMNDERLKLSIDPEKGIAKG